MANQIILKKSSVAAKAPVAADLEYGELALNYSDGKLYYKKADNSIDAFTAGTGSASNSSSYIIKNITSAYTVVASDLGSIINCTSGSLTISLTNASILGAGFNCWIWNTSSSTSDIVTIDPNSNESIESKATHVLRAGEGAEIICTGSNWLLGGKKAMLAYAENMIGSNSPVASGSVSVAIGHGNTASGAFSTALGGANNVASGNYSVAIGSLGDTGSVAAGTSATSIGGSYASGSGSFAAAVANNTTAYGAAQADSIAIGYYAKCVGNAGLALGYLTNVGGPYSVGIGYGATTTAAYSIAISASHSSKASAEGGVAIGTNALAATVGKYAYSGSYFYGEGSAQTGTYVLSAETSTAQTTARLRTNTALANSTNQIILPNNSAYAFTGIVVARQQSSAGTQAAAWQLKGLIRREGTAGSTVLVTSILEVISYPSSTWTISMSADTTNGGLAINVTSPSSAGNIRWVATVQTSEVIYA